MAMTKKDLVLRVSKETGITQVDVKRVAQRFLHHLVEALKDGQTIELRNFGVLEPRIAPPRIRRNPRTGERVEVPERFRVKFKPGKGLRDE